MIVLDCAACADERAAGAAFCEACGRDLNSTVEGGPADPVAEIGGSATSGGAGHGGRLEADDPDPGGEPDPSSGRRRACPHCGATRAVGADGYCEECGMLAGRPRDHIEADGGAVAAAVSDRGRRHHRNEDAMWLAVGEAAADVVVCDGVSASYDPDAASEIAARTAGELLAAAQHPSDEPGDEDTLRLGADDETTRLQAGADTTTVLPGDAEATTVLPGDPDATTVLPGRVDPDATAVLPGRGDPDATAVLPGGDAETTVVIADAESHGTGDSGVREKAQTSPAVAIAGVVAAAIAGAAEAVVSLAHTGDPRRAASNPACTIVAAAVRGPHVGFGWVGDSRIYWIDGDGPAEQLTEDDSWATHMIALGADPIEAMDDPRAHAITAWLGADAGPIMPRVGAFTATADGLLVLCSDGLWNYLPDPAAFGATVREAVEGSATLLEAARALVKFANTAGGADNITVALVPVLASTAADIEN
ncbi:PP2C family serine/threonine-protein phosphatase [Actinoplanes sp. NPDC023714]|uniref:PP2C family protein-serine/threonine phosphatase n=1 Tax=Actinoplanes sp. NPDC023714 TaxID=3154322 RepID=UPI0033D7E216